MMSDQALPVVRPTAGGFVRGRQSQLVKCALMACCLTVSDQSQARADDSASDWQPYFLSVAKSYEMAAMATPEQQFQLRSEPILRWSQPVRGGDDGAVFLWLDEGVPAVVGTIFCWPHSSGQRVVQVEFHSLIDQPLVAEREGDREWAPTTGGIEWNAFKDAPPPASRSSIRLLQMKQLSQRFSGTNGELGADEFNRLRLLPTPMLRFDRSQTESEPDDILDGGLFALAHGTDPEVWVLVAARSYEGEFRWEWAVARFSDKPVTTSLDERQVFSVPRANPTRDNVHTFYQLGRLDGPPQPLTPNP